MSRSQEEKTKPKLPVRQLAILAVVRFSEPVALTSVFPYLPEMIKSFGVPRDEVARWAGLTSAVFSIAQSATAVLWGWISDRLGRKPTLIIGLLSTMICFIVWGMSTSLAVAITVRAIHGGSNGNVGIIRTMVAEMVPEKVLQPRAFSIMPMVWSIGAAFGPSFGGFFAQPAEQFPGLFGNSAFLKKYPFVLPNLIACVIFLFSVITAMLFLHETLDTKRHKRDWGLKLGDKLVGLFSKTSKPTLQSHARAHTHAQNRAHRRSFADADITTPLLPARDSQADAENQSPPPSGYGHLFTYQTCMALLCYSLLAMHSVAYDQVLPVFLNYPYRAPNESNTKLPFKFSSGFGLESGRIGTMFTINAIISGLAQFLIFPPLCSRFGALRCYRFASVLMPFLYFITPYTALVPGKVLRFTAFMVVFVVKGSLGIVTFPCITIILTNSASSTKILGTLNGFATTFSGVGRALGPAMAGATFTWGMKRGYMIAGMWLLAFFASLSAIASFFLEEGKGLGTSEDTNADDVPDYVNDSDDDNDGSIENRYIYDDNDDDYEESLLENTGHNDEYAPLEPASPSYQRKYLLSLPELQPPTEPQLQFPRLLPEPEDPDPYTSGEDGLADVDLSAPTTPVRDHRYRSGSNLSKGGRSDTTTDAAGANGAVPTPSAVVAGVGDAPASVRLRRMSATGVDLEAHDGEIGYPIHRHPSRGDAEQK